MTFPFSMQHSVAASVNENRAAGKTYLTGGAIKDEAIYRKMMCDAPIAEGVPFSQEMGKANIRPLCRFPVSGSRSSMKICGKPAVRQSYCEGCYDLCYIPAKKGSDRHSIKIVESETKPAQSAAASVVDLFGEVIEC